MVGTLIKSVGLLLVSYFAFWFIFGWPNNGVKDIVASKMLFGEESNSIEMLKEGYKSELKNYNNEIFNFEFEALGEFGVRRSSNVIGQAFDFLRFSDKNCNTSVRIYAKNSNISSIDNEVMISINATFYNVNRTLNQKQIELNQEICGSSNCISYVENFSIKDIQLTDQYLIINTKRNIRMIEIDSLQYLVESSLYLSVYFDQNLNKSFKNSSYDNVLFNK